MAGGVSPRSSAPRFGDVLRGSADLHVELTHVGGSPFVTGGHLADVAPRRLSLVPETGPALVCREQDTRGRSPALLCAGSASAGVLWPVLGTAVQEGSGGIGEGPEKSGENDPRAGERGGWRQAERTGPAEFGKEQAEGDLRAVSALPGSPEQGGSQARTPPASLCCAAPGAIAWRGAEPSPASAAASPALEWPRDNGANRWLCREPSATAETFYCERLPEACLGPSCCYRTFTVALGLMVLVLIAAVAFLAAQPPPADPGPPAMLCCPDSWLGYHRKCYYFSEVEGNWTGGGNHCSALGASLAEIHTQQEMAFLLHYKGKLEYWIGLRRDPGQPWKWSDGTEFNSRFVVRGGGDCAYLNDEGGVSSSQCSSDRFWICTKSDAFTTAKGAVGAQPWESLTALALGRQH
ncbi:uncharacterized protein LOC142004143 [Carettochelys insculpta]|uniref:uncharacterized protein LOC142004143 n=1 Tax=Carettochelys insculpta TaxID=44489 RepID=UPI003EBD21BF